MAEQTKKLCFFDIEATGLRGDYNSVLVVSVKPYGSKPRTFQVAQSGNDQRLVREVGEYLEQFLVWCGYYSKGFDIPMLNTRRLKWGQLPIEKRLHLDMYYTLKSNLLTARRSQAHLLSWLGTPEQKLTVSADIWNQALHPEEREHAMSILVKRCESDVKGLEGLYIKTRHVIADIKK